MKTIEERADALYPISNDDYNEPVGYYTYADLKTDECNAYIKGATDQKQIEIDKACTEVEDLLYQCKRLGIHTIPQLVVKFRKAMES